MSWRRGRLWGGFCVGRRMGPAFRVLHWLLVGVTVAALIFVGLLGLRVLMGERVEFKRNSLDYMVLMDSSFIEGIDAGDCEASYYFLLGEDGQNDIHGVVLTHHEFPVEVIDALRKYVDSRGCSG